jgi:uncharacterized protein YbjT (DUF2867 family)
MTRKVLLVGVTGLVGRECLALLLADPTVGKLTALVRKPPADAPKGAKLRVVPVDFDHLDRQPELFEVDQVICALGTTIKVAGSQEAFRRVDFDYPLAVARKAREHGARHFLLVSALGADAGSRVFYNRVKGELEQALTGLGYPAMTIVRPSLLLGERRQKRPGEEFAKLFGWAVPRRYRPVEAKDVAAALVSAAAEDRPGRRIIESAEIVRKR